MTHKEKIAERNAAVDRAHQAMTFAVGEMSMAETVIINMLMALYWQQELRNDA